MAGDTNKQRPRRSMSARLAKSLTGGWSRVDPAIEPLLSIHRKFYPKADAETIERAYHTAERLHEGVLRKSGDPYITHPLAVATISAEMGMDTTTVVASLLHDTVEDTDYTLADLTRDFGEEVAKLVDGVTKIDKVALGAAAEAETIRKMVVAMAEDPRVLVIKVSDRLHNMRTMRFLPPEKQAKKARQTLEVIAPLAHRLGLASVKWELEDLSFAILYPKKYDEIVRLVAERAPARDRQLKEIIAAVKKELKANHIIAEVVGRPKHYWSIYKKMTDHGHDFNELFDLVGIRILVDTKALCYEAIGVMHSLYPALPGRFKDYISNPRYGVYESLHTTLLGPNGKPLEVQVRTHEMHYQAEYGVAAHWRYKETKGKHTGGQAEVDQMAWMRQLLDWQKEASDPNEFLDTLRRDLSSKQIFVFTPKSDVINLPAGSTPVDFAYQVHTEVGHRTIGAKVNGRLVALETKLNNGDRVEVFTSKDPDAGPSKDWESFVASPRAKAKIRQWFARERRQEAQETGKSELTTAMQRSGFPLSKVFTEKTVKVVADELHYQDSQAMFAAIGSGTETVEHVSKRLIALFGDEEIPDPEKDAEALAEELIAAAPRIQPNKKGHKGNEAGILVEGDPDIAAKLARCCMPVPGDAIFGFITRGGGVSVHRVDCTNAEQLHKEPSRLINVSWARESQGIFSATLQVEALDRDNLLFDLMKVVSEQKVSLLATSSHSSDDNVAFCRFSFQVSDTKQLGALTSQLRNVEGVYDVYRLTSGG